MTVVDSCVDSSIVNRIDHDGRKDIQLGQFQAFERMCEGLRASVGSSAARLPVGDEAMRYEGAMHYLSVF